MYIDQFRYFTYVLLHEGADVERLRAGLPDFVERHIGAGATDWTSLGLQRLTQALDGARRERTRVAVLLVDLDDFKPIHDRHGHAVGDWVLRELADRLSSCVRGRGTVARFGGDEFFVVLTGVDDRTAGARAAEELLRYLSRPLRIAGREARVGGSIGIATYPDHGASPEELLERADEAMYVAKRRGKNRFCLARED